MPSPEQPTGEATTSAGPALLPSAEALQDRARAVAHLMADVTGGLVTAMTPTAQVEQVRAAVGSLLDVVPPIGRELSVVVRELHAKRATIGAVQQELAVLDEQLAVLERSLAPLEAWLGQWSRLRERLGVGGGA